MTIRITKTDYPANSRGLDKPASIVAYSIDRQLIAARVYISGKLIAVLDNMFDAGDIVEDGTEFIAELKADTARFEIAANGALVSKSLGGIINA
jgi:hypothetical protein